MRQTHLSKPPKIKIRKLHLLTILAALVILAVPSYVFAQAERILEYMGPGRSVIKFGIDYRLTVQAPKEAKEQNTSFSWIEQEYGFSVPVIQRKNDVLIGTTHMRSLDFTTDALMPDTGERFPENLWDGRISLSYGHRFNSRWAAGGILTHLASGEKTFSRPETQSTGGTAVLLLLTKKKSAWIFYLNVDSNREILNNLPLPGVAYHSNPTPKLKLTIGIPFISVAYKTSKKTRLEASYFPWQKINARFTYKSSDKLSLYTSFGWEDKHFTRRSRPKDDYRIYFTQKRAALGTQFQLTKFASLEIYTSYAFDRVFFEGNKWNETDFNRITLGDNLQTAAKLYLRF